MAYTDLINGFTITDGLKDNKVAKFAYTNIAYINNDVEGHDTYSSAQSNNIPTENGTDFNSNIINNGVRSQASSIPRNAINHFFGRVSYNLNKIIDVVYYILASLIVDVRHNLREWDAAITYQSGDTVWMQNTYGDILFYMAKQSNINHQPPLAANGTGDDDTYWQCTNRSNVYMYVEDGALHIEDGHLN